MILVTGGTGFIGSHLVDRLAAQGCPFRCLVRRTSHVSNLPLAPSQLVYGDLVSGEGLAEALRGVETVIHLAGVTKARTSAGYHSGNAVATANLLRAAAGVRRFVHVSSMAAAGPSCSGESLTEDAAPQPVSHYGRSKLAAEEAVRNSELRERAVVVRPPVVYGPRDTDVYQVIRGVARGWMPRIGKAERRFSLIYVSDLVDGLLAAADRESVGGKTFFIAHAVPISWDEFAHTAARLMNRSVRTFAIPENAAYVLALCAEWWTRLSGKPGILSRDKIAEACCEGWVCDTALARRELGFCASTALRDGLRQTVEWYRKAGWLKC
jgi:nucleoside-diphosphate-sugar epimerase